jgi:hypothetical protein
MSAVQATAVRNLFKRSDPRDQRWYFDAHELIADRADQLGIPVRRLAGIVAALSPNNAWDTPSGKTPNLDCAERFIRTGANVHVGTCMRKARAILAGADPADVLTGAKERSFADNLSAPADSDAVTCDRWVARAIGKRTERFTPKQYRETADMFRSTAAALSIRPHELQAAVWAVIRRES